MAPEAFRGDISVKLDTFSYGVVSINSYSIYNFFVYEHCASEHEHLINRPFIKSERNLSNKGHLFRFGTAYVY